MKKYMYLILLACNALSAMGPQKPPYIRNLGNLCYMDATLQCLYQIEPLTQFMLTHGATFYKPNSIAAKYAQFIKLAHEKITSQSATIAPEDFCIPVFDAFFGRPHAQEDAGEFLTFLLAHLTEIDVKPTEKIPGQATPSIKTQKKFGLLLPDNPVYSLFLSIIKSTITPDDPKECAPTTKFEPYLQIEVPLQNADKTAHFETLIQGLDEYIAMQRLTGENQYACENPKKMINATKKLSFESTADHLIIQLKRFSYDPASKSISKLSFPVTFPLKLDFSSYVTAAKSGSLYELFGVVQHTGSFGSGHYNAYVKSNDQWFFVDDSPPTVKPLTNAEILGLERVGYIQSSFSPYILFYKRAKPDSLKKDRTDLSDLSNLRARLTSLNIRFNMLKQASR